MIAVTVKIKNAVTVTINSMMLNALFFMMLLLYQV